MTKQEHLFLLTLYAHQNFKFELLFEALTAARTLQSDDLLAYRQFVIDEKPEAIAESLRVAWQFYQSAAERLGLTTGLEQGAPPPNQN